MLEVIDPATMRWLSGWSPSLSWPSASALAKHIVGHLSSLNEHQIQVLGWSALAYAAISGAEALGLWLGYRWGQWLSAVISGLFIPVELIDGIRHPSLFRSGLVMLNVAVLLYLVLRICSDRRRHTSIATTDVCA